MTRAIVNLFNTETNSETITKADPMVAVAAVDNSMEGVCPKCRKAMGTGYITVGTVYYCTPCRVAAPVPEA